MKSLMPWKKREREVANLRKDFGRLFDRFFDEPLFPIPNLFSEDAWYPTVDISEDKKGIIVKAEIPGVDQKDIEVYLAGRSLTIKGEKKREKDEAGYEFPYLFDESQTVAKQPHLNSGESCCET